MIIEKIDWCFNLKKGIKLIKDNDNLSRGYIEKSESFLKEINSINNKDLKVSVAYYVI